MWILVVLLACLTIAMGSLFGTNWKRAQAPKKTNLVLFKKCEESLLSDVSLNLRCSHVYTLKQMCLSNTNKNTQRTLYYLCDYISELEYKTKHKLPMKVSCACVQFLYNAVSKD